MKKLFLLLPLFFINLFSYSQISVSSRHAAGAKKIKQENLDRFKNSKTIFILSNIYEKSAYEKILNESWKVTPFEVVDAKNFDYEKYLTNDFSFVDLNVLSNTVQRSPSSVRGTYLYFNMDVFMYKTEKVVKKISKLRPTLKEKKRKRKIKDILIENRVDLARVYLFPNATTLKDEISSEKQKGPTEDELFFSLFYNKKLFNNYTLGYLKNYFQKISNVLSDNKTYWLYGTDFLPELKNLSSTTLYVPKYLGNIFNGFIGKENDKGSERIEELFTDYNFKYEIKSSEEISEMILTGEEFYYLTYVRMNSEKFLNVVNSKTGEIVYRNYIPGMSYNLKAKKIKRLNTVIKKSLKK